MPSTKWIEGAGHDSDKERTETAEDTDEQGSLGAGGHEARTNPWTTRGSLLNDLKAGIGVRQQALGSSSCKKGGRPLNQPVGGNDADAVGDGYIEPVKCALDQGGLR
jgi:hypothetical protein